MNLGVVFDTNVLFLRRWLGGKPGGCVDLVRAGRIRGLTCVEILEELADKLSSKLHFDAEQIEVITCAPSPSHVPPTALDPATLPFTARPITLFDSINAVRLVAEVSRCQMQPVIMAFRCASGSPA